VTEEFGIAWQALDIGSGLGVGLSSSRGIVEAHGGRVSAAANAPEGTVFSIALPLRDSDD
jgi:signal transduction histidine kinase